MKVLITDVRQPLSEDDGQIARLLAAQCGLEEGRVRSARIVRRSLDARKKQDSFFTQCLAIWKTRRQKSCLGGRRVSPINR
jgi:hypothetical protein